jgi:GT2 family glycosyltransferase
MTAAVVVCTSSHGRAALLRACVDSVMAGTRRADELFVVVDQNPSLQAALARSLPASVKLLKTERDGLSEARNVGIHAAHCDVVAFVDDDATVEAQWFASIVDAFEQDDGLIGVGGPVVPRWGAERRWLADELLWMVGCTYRGHRQEAGPVRNPLGCNMAFRRRELVEAGGFSVGFGKRGNALETCDETELSLRLAREYGPGRIRHLPAARVHHFVPPARISWRLLVRRSLSEGLSKGRLHRLYGRSALGPESRHIRRLVLDCVPRLLLGGLVRRDGYSMLGAVAVAVSLFITSCAFLAGVALAGRVKRHHDLPCWGTRYLHRQRMPHGR